MSILFQVFLGVVLGSVAVASILTSIHFFIQFLTREKDSDKCGNCKCNVNCNKED